MKLREFFLLIFVNIILYSASAVSGEFTGAESVKTTLEKHKMTQTKLENLGLKVVISGEFSGASLVDVEYLITKNALIHMDHIDQVFFKSNTIDKNMGNVIGVLAFDKAISIREVEAIIVVDWYFIN